MARGALSAAAHSLLAGVRAAGSTASALATSNSMLTCGTGCSAGHSGLPKQASAACDSGQIPKDLHPATSSLWRYSSPSSSRPSASRYSFRLAGGSGVMTATVERNLMWRPPRSGTRGSDPTRFRNRAKGRGLLALAAVPGLRPADAFSYPRVAGPNFRRVGYSWCHEAGTHERAVSMGYGVAQPSARRGEASSLGDFVRGGVSQPR